MTPQDDARLSEMLRRGLAGDERQYARFLREIACKVRAVASSRVAMVDGIDAEDIVQETLMAVHLKRQTWKTDQPVGPWISAIARYKLVDAFRRRGRRIELDVADFENLLSVEETDRPSDREIGRALDGLPSGQRNVVSAIGVEGRTIAETAARLGMKENAVRVALHRGLSAIAARFGAKVE